MTRINLVPPLVLTDKHLMAEYRELPRIFTTIYKLIDQGKTPGDINIPDNYVLGKGHVKFFYNKCRWLFIRYNELTYELRSRDYNLNEELIDSIKQDVINILEHTEWFGYSVEYKPTPEEIYLNMARICKRSKIDSVLEELSSD